MIWSLVPHSGAARLPAQLSTVSGINRSDEAKIGGMTPAVLSLIGRGEGSCCMPRAGLRLGDLISTLRQAARGRALGMLDQRRPLGALNEADEQYESDRQGDDADDQQAVDRAGAA